MTLKIPSSADDAEQLEIQQGRRAPYTMAPDWVRHAPITPTAKELHTVLAGHISQQRDDSEVWPTQDQLADILGMSEGRKIRRYLNELIEIDAIETRTIRTHGGLRKRTIYTVHQTPPAGWTHPTSYAEYYAQVKASAQVIPEGPCGAPREGLKQAPPEGPSEAPREGPCGAPEPNQPEPDQREPDQPTTGPANSTGSTDDGAVDGWMAEENKHGEDSGGAPSAGDRLLASVERRNSAHLVAQRDEHVRTVEAALEVLPRDRVLSVLGDGLDTAKRPAGALVDRIRQLPEQVRQHQAERQRLAERDRKLTEQDTAPQQPANSPGAAETGPTPSPVDWLTDEQYTALSLQDQAKVRAFAGTAPEDLTEKASMTLAAIHRKVMEPTG